MLAVEPAEEISSHDQWVCCGAGFVIRPAPGPSCLM